jgi:hypothetical protein
MPAIDLHARRTHRRHAVRDIDLFASAPTRAIATVLREPRLALQPEHAVAIEGQREHAFITEFRQAAKPAVHHIQPRHAIAAGDSDLPAAETNAPSISPLPRPCAASAGIISRNTRPLAARRAARRRRHRQP